MKTGIGRIMAGMGLLTATLLRAQETTNIDWASASDLQVELQAIEQTPPLPAADAINGIEFFSAKHAPGTSQPWPPLPGNVFGLSAWDLGGGRIFAGRPGLSLSSPAQGQERELIQRDDVDVCG